MSIWNSQVEEIINSFCFLSWAFERENWVRKTCKERINNEIHLSIFAFFCLKIYANGEMNERLNGV
jgi:hypothetical protein